MKMPPSAKYVLGVTAAVALLAGCSGGSTSQLAPATGSSATGATKVMQNGKVVSTSVLNPKVKRHGSIPVLHTHAIKPNCCANTKTLFVSDSGENTVQTYEYPSGSYIGQLAAPPEGFEEPQGLCSDKMGDVYIANTEEFTIDEYSHSGTFLQALSDPDGYPAGCAVNKKTGDVAVTNIIGFSGPGNVIVFKGGTGTPTAYNTGLYENFFIGYVGNSSVAWVSGINDGTYGTGLAALNTSTGNATPIALNGATIGFPGTVTYSGKLKQMVVGDQDTFSSPTFYAVNSTTYAVTGSTSLTCSNNYQECDIVQATVKGGKIVGPDAESANADIYPFPEGGNPSATVTTNLVEPIGSAVSPDKS
jgi:hypothetical protein